MLAIWGFIMEVDGWGLKELAEEGVAPGLGREQLHKPRRRESYVQRAAHQALWLRGTEERRTRAVNTD